MSARDLFKKYKLVINSHDFNQIAPLLSEDCKFWFSSSTNQGIDQARKAFVKTWGIIKNEVYSISDTTWIAEDDSAAACTYTYHWKGFIDGELCEGLGRGTSCFRREKDGWKIIHEHLSAFPK